MVYHWRSWDQRFMGLAFHVSSWSKDPSTQVGAVIVNARNQVLSLGYNGFPRGIVDSVERLQNRQTKYAFIAHAERNALDNAECPVVGATLYTTLCPCNECAKSIVQRGISRVVSPLIPSGKDHWDFTSTQIMFKETNVTLDFVAVEQ